MSGLRPRLCSFGISQRRSLAKASVPIPKFASFCGILICELRNRDTCSSPNMAIQQTLSEILSFCLDWLDPPFVTHIAARDTLRCRDSIDLVRYRQVCCCSTTEQ